MTLEINPAARLADRDYQHAPVVRSDHAEGPITRLIASGFFLVGAAGAMLASAIFELRGRTRLSSFVGMWAPTLMIAGIYNKIIKTVGSR
jgi:hypothetical protein